MPKKISIYTAFGQFLEFVEELENRNEISVSESTDRYLVGLFTPSERDITSGMDMKNLQVHSCPTVLNDEADYSSASIRKSQSCPAFKFQISSIESQYLNDVTPAMMAFFDISTTKSSVESQVLNAATEHMMSFWTVNVTLRRKTSSIPSLFEKFDGYFEESAEPAVPSIFEKLDGLFAETDDRSKLPSLFEKLSKLLSENPDVYTNECLPSIFEKLGGLFSESTDSTAATVTSSTLEPLVHKTNCMCFSCWKSTLNWKSRDAPNIPQLPVFVKSPIDSLRLYTGTRSPSTSCRCSYEADVEDNADTITSPVYGPHPRNVESPLQNILLKKIQMQQEVIDKLIKLNELSEKIANLQSPQ